MSKNNKTVDRIQAVWNKLGGEEGVDRLLNGETMIVAVDLTKKIWNKIKLGTFKNIGEIRKILKKSNVNVSDWASDILGRVILSDKEEEFDLVNVSPAELGLKGNVSRKEVYNQAIINGLELCPAEVGPLAVLQFGSQFKGVEWFVIAMKPVTDSDGDQGEFSVRRYSGGELWLDIDYGGDLGPIWDNDRRLVFIRPKSK